MQLEKEIGIEIITDIIDQVVYINATYIFTKYQISFGILTFHEMKYEKS